MPSSFFSSADVTPGQQIISGMQAFSESVNQLAMQKSLQTAQQQIDIANDNIKDDFDRYQAYRQVGQQLAFQLAGAGADSTKINTLVDAIPKPAPLPQNALQAAVSPDKGVRDRAAAFETAEQGRKMAQIRAQTSGRAEVAQINAAAGLKKQERAQAIKEQAEFQRLDEVFARQKDIAPLLEERAPLVKAKDLLAEGKDINAALEMVKTFMARASGETRVSDEDVRRLSGNPDLKSAFARYSSLSAKGVLPEKDRQGLMRIVEALEASNRKILESKVDSFAQSKAYRGSGQFSYEDYRSKAAKRAGLISDKQTVAAPPASTTTAQAPAGLPAIPGVVWK